jgi:TIR domain
LAIAVTCNHCGAHLRFKNEHRGRSAKCNACQQSLIVQGETIPDHDIFISYSSKDKNVADAVCAALEAKRIRCWIAPRDIMPGKQWAGAILDAIEETRLMVLIYSASANASPQVIREVDRAVTRNVIILPFRIEAAEMSKEMQYYISAAHWLDAIDGPMDQHIARLVVTVKRLLSDRSSSFVQPASPVHPSANKSSLAWIIWPIAMLLLLGVGIGVWFLEHPRMLTQASPVVSPSTSQPAATPTTNSTGTVDLLAGVQLPDDILGETWTRDADGIRSETKDNGFAKLKFRYKPHGEYDFTIIFARQSGERMVSQVLSYGGKSFAWVMGRNLNRIDGFELIDGVLASQNRSGVPVRISLVNGQKYTSTVKVRKNSVAAYIDGKLVSQITTDYSDLSIPKIHDMGPDCLGITANDSVLIYAASVTPVSDRLTAIPIASQSSAPTTRPQSKPAAPQDQEWVDLLKLSDPSRDSLAGSWKLINGELSGNMIAGTPASGARLELPYEPAEEYDFRVSFTCVDKNAGVSFICRGGDHQFHWGIPPGRNVISEIGLVDGLPGNRVRVGGDKSQWLFPGRRQIAFIKVRKDGIESYVDDKMACQFKTDYTNLRLNPNYSQPHPITLGLCCGPGAVTFESIELFNVSGKGTPLR